MRKKLNSNGGAAIAIALLYFLICSMVSAVLLASAKANVSRVNLQTQQENRYLAAVSAAEFLCDEIAACRAEATVFDTDRDSPADDGEILQYQEDLLDRFLDSADNEVQREILSAVYGTYLDYADGAFPGEQEKEFVFSLEESEDVARIPKVHAVLTVKPDSLVMDSIFTRQLHVTMDCRLKVGDDTGWCNMSLDTSGLVSFYLEEIVNENTDVTTGAVHTTYDFTAHAVISMDRPIVKPSGLEEGEEP